MPGQRGRIDQVANRVGIASINMFVSDAAGTAEYDTGGKLLESNSTTYVIPSDLPTTQPTTFQTWILPPPHP